MLFWTMTAAILFVFIGIPLIVVLVALVLASIGFIADVVIAMVIGLTKK